MYDDLKKNYVLVDSGYIVYSGEHDECEERLKQLYPNDWSVKLNNRQCEIRKDSFLVKTITREDLDSMGYDSSQMSDADMEYFASKLGDALQDPYWISAEVIAEERFELKKNE